MRFFPLATVFSVALAACGTTYDMAGGAGPPQPVRAVQPASVPAARGAGQGVADFRRVAPRVKRVADAFCREENPGQPARYCNFKVRLIDDPRAPPNAFQTIDRDGRPLLGVTTALLRQTGSADEIAFVMSHEAGHHIAGHLAKQQSSQMAGALIAGVLASALGGQSGDGGATQSVRQAMDMGSFLGGRVYSQPFELEADVVGAYITARAGYDPDRGALIFTRPALGSGGQGLLSTHPPSPRRLQTVARATTEIRRQQAAGVTPRPARAR